MLLDELWIDRLAKDADIEPETSARLWQAFGSQLESRLAMGMDIYIREAGYWSTHTDGEYLAILPNLERYLIPPIIRLAISYTPAPNRAYMELGDLCEALVQATEVRPEAVARWLAAIEPRLAKGLSSGRQTAWAGLGVFTPIIEAESLRGFSFAPEVTLSEVLNRPFGMFSPVAVVAPEAAEGLEEREVESLEQCLATAAIEVLKPLCDEDLQPEAALRAEPEVCVVEPLPIAHTPNEPVESDQANEAPQIEPADSQIDLLAQQEVNPQHQATPPERPQAKSSPVASTQRGQRGRWVGLLILLLILLVGIWALWQYLERRPMTTVQPQHRPPVHSERVTPTPAPADTATTGTDSAHIASPMRAEETTQPRPSAAPKPAIAPAASDAPNRGIEAEEIVIKPGDSLVQISLRKYGHKAFWVYIYEENRDRIKNPDNIPLGTRLSLPAARKYGIDSSNTNSVDRALSLQRALLRNRKK